MRNKVAKRLKRHAEKVTIGMSEAETERQYKALKKSFRKTNGDITRSNFLKK